MQQQEVPKEVQDAAAAAGPKDQQLQGAGQVGAPDVQEDNLFDMQEDHPGPAAAPAVPAAQAGQQHPEEEQPEGGSNCADSGGRGGGIGGRVGGLPEDMDVDGTPEGQGEEGCCVCRRPLHIKDTDMGCEWEVCGCSAHKASCWRGMCRLCSDEQQRPWRPSKFNEDCPVCGLVLTAEVPMAQCLRCKQWGCYRLCINGF